MSTSRRYRWPVAVLSAGALSLGAAVALAAPAPLAPRPAAPQTSQGWSGSADASQVRAAATKKSRTKTKKTRTRTKKTKTRTTSPGPTTPPPTTTTPPRPTTTTPSPTDTGSRWETVIDSSSLTDWASFEKTWNYLYPWGSDHNGSARMYGSSTDHNHVQLSGGVLSLLATRITWDEGNSGANPSRRSPTTRARCTRRARWW
ncbi:MAG: hypothetical protein U0Q15_05940 [Kineosporiaceae bacterium]